MTQQELKKLEFIDAVDDIVRGLDTAESSDLGDLYDKLQQEFIDQACEWLEFNAEKYVDDIDAIHLSALIGDFKYAIKGDKE